MTAIQAAGEIHRAISAATVMVADNLICILRGGEPQVLLGGEAADDNLIPPDLRRSGPWHLPRDASGIGRLFRG